MHNIALCHGFLGFDRIGPLNYFDGVKAGLEKAFAGEVRVEPTKVNPIGSIAERGAQLREQILAMFPGDAKVHIIAHSMGGLDARFLASPANPNNLAAKILSITTVATPHRGSPVADVLRREPKLSLRTEATVFPDVQRLIGQIRALDDLTTEGAAEFNAHFGDAPNVVYREIAGRGRRGLVRTSLLLLPFHQLIESADGVNDGLVSVRSATRRNLIDIWPADHFDEIGHTFGGALVFRHLPRYVGLVEEIVA